MDERCAVHKGTYSFGREGDFAYLFLGEKEILNNPFREKGKNSVFDCSFLSGFRPFGGHKPCFDAGCATAKARCKRKTGRRAVRVSECARRGGGDGEKTPRFSPIIGTFSAIHGDFSGHLAEFSSGLRPALRRGGRKTRIPTLLRGAPGRWRAERRGAVQGRSAP